MLDVNQRISKILQSTQPAKTLELINQVNIDGLTEVNQCIQIAQVALEISAICKTVELSTKALSLEPENQALYTNLVTTHMFQKDSHNALKVCEMYVAKFGDNPVVQSLMGNAYAAIGNFELSEQSYKEALKGESKLLPAIQGLTKSKKFDEKEAIELIQNYQLTLDETPHPQAKALINYSIAKLYNDIGYFEAAWNQASQANELINQFNSPERATFSTNLNEIMKNYSSPVESSDSDAEPILIVGMPRSGTTLLENIISNNKCFYAGGEAPSLVYAVTMAGGEQKSTHTLRKEALNVAAEYYQNYYLEFSGNSESQRIINKLPINFMNLGLFKQLFPKGKVIYIKRDYRDVIASSFMENFSLGDNYTTSVENIIFMIKECEKIMSFWLNKLDSILEINYQDLVTKSEESNKLIAEFLNVESASFKKDESEESNIETPSLWQVRQPIFTSSIGRFQNYEALKNLPEQITSE